MSLASAAAIAGVLSLATAPPAPVELRSLQQFRQRFNADAGKVRLVLLLSPT